MSLERELQEIIETLEEFEKHADPLQEAIEPILERYLGLIMENPAMERLVAAQARVQLCKALIRANPELDMTSIATLAVSLYEKIQ